jgi:hypothetical protein
LIPYKDVAIGLGAFAIGFAIVRALESSTRPPSPAPSPPSPPFGEQPIPITNDLVTLPGHTYFVVLETNGTVSAAATPARVKAKAEELGFRDVAVFTQSDRPSAWPGTVRGDYYVRGTYRGTDQKTLPRKTGVFLGSVVVLDAWLAPL